jgi:hypothetical protein
MTEKKYPLPDKIVRKFQMEQCCIHCGEPAQEQLTFLLYNARKNPQSKGYGKDNISWCSDAEAFSCGDQACERTIKQEIGEQDYEWCSTFKRTPHFEHLFWLWIEEDITDDSHDKLNKEE